MTPLALGPLGFLGLLGLLGLLIVLHALLAWPPWASLGPLGLLGNLAQGGGCTIRRTQGGGPPTPRRGSQEAPDCCVHAVFYSMNCTIRSPLEEPPMGS